MLEYKVIVDSREQTPWSFPPFINGKFKCLGSEIKTLQTGDYSLSGYENEFSIERKTLTDFAKSIVEDRFYRELERLNNMKFTFLLLDFNTQQMLEYPYSCKLPFFVIKKIKLRGDFLLKKLVEIQFNYPNIHILFCDGKGADIATSVFKRVIENGPSTI